MERSRVVWKGWKRKHERDAHAGSSSRKNKLCSFCFSRPGVNLRTGRQGIFPSAYAVDMDYSDFDPSAPKVKRERYLLGYLGSVETQAHKGTGVVCQAVRRILRNSSHEPPVSQSCILEVSDQGLRMVDRSKPRVSGAFAIINRYYFLRKTHTRIENIILNWNNQTFGI